MAGEMRCCHHLELSKVGWELAVLAQGATPPSEEQEAANKNADMRLQGGIS